MRRVINVKHLAQSLSAILVGFVLVGIILVIIGYNPFTVGSLIFLASFQSKFAFQAFSFLFVSACIVSLSSSFAFKGKVFNIGIPGQMLAAANLTTYLALAFFPNGLFLGWFWFVIIGAIVGGLVGYIVGYLKSKFNINEVLSTIMMNWIFFYFGKFMYINSEFSDNKIFGSKAWPNSFKVPLYFALTLMIGCVFLVWFIFSKTTLGYKIEMVGTNEHAANYAGIKTKKIQKLILIISGTLAGMAGVIYYGVFIGNYRVPLTDSLDSIGFLGITIALLSFKNPFAILILSIFFSALQIGGIVAASVVQISLIIMALLLGFIFYAFACFTSNQHNLFKRFEIKEGRE